MDTSPEIVFLAARRRFFSALALVALAVGCAGSDGLVRRSAYRSIVESGLRYLESMEGDVTLVVPSDVPAEIREVLLGISNVISGEQMSGGGGGALPAGRARFEGLILEGDHAELGFRVGPIDPAVEDGPGRCGTKYRFMMDRRGGEWELRHYLVGGC